MRAATGWRFYGWWGIVLPAFVVIWITNALTPAGSAVFDRAILDELALSRGALKFGDTLQLLGPRRPSRRSAAGSPTATGCGPRWSPAPCCG